jgi:hypothetical protein
MLFSVSIDSKRNFDQNVSLVKWCILTSAWWGESSAKKAANLSGAVTFTAFHLDALISSISVLHKARGSSRRLKWNWYSDADGRNY